MNRVFNPSNSIPAPDARVTELENKWIKNPTPTTTVEELSAGLSKLGVTASTSQDVVLPRRPAYGTAGNATIVWANFFSVNIKARTLYKYALTVTRPADLKKQTAGSKKPAGQVLGKVRREVVRKALAEVQKRNTKAVIVSEFKAQVVSSADLSLPDDRSVKVQHVGSGRKKAEDYVVQFADTEAIDIGNLLTWLSTMDDRLDPTTFPKFSATIDAIGVIIGHQARVSDDVVPLGSARFYPSETRPGAEFEQLSALRQIVRGFFLSARPATGRLLINLNVTAGIFCRSGSLDVLLVDLFREVNLQAGDYRTFKWIGVNRKLKRVKMEVCMWEKDGKERWVERSITGLSKGTAREIKFRLNPPADPSSDFWLGGKPLPYGTDVTVADYYQRKYKKTVKPNLPLVATGTPKNTLYFPAEFCRAVKDQNSTGRLNAQESTNMINFACRSPFSNAESITTKGRELLSLTGVNRILREFGIDIGQDMITVNARILPSPKISYLGAAGQVPADGSWNMRNVKVVQPGSITSWGFININGPNPRFQASREEVTNVMKAFAEFQDKNMGIKIGPLTPNTKRAEMTHREGSELEDFRNLVKSIAPVPMMLFVVIPDAKDATLYNAIKRVGDVELGVHTVCMVRKNLFNDRGQLQYFANVGLKVNLKGGGVNHKLSNDIPLLKAGKTMVVGWDVLHPTNLGVDKESGLPSVAGLVATVDGQLGQWPAVGWAQAGGQEMADSKLQSAFESRLRLWMKHNQNRLPENILIFRDGVSEGQFATVINVELPMVRKACAAVYSAKQQPKITIVTAVKRHQTRFFPANENFKTKTGNVLPGTVVDRDVTTARYWSYYIVAHNALKGTARPASYTVLYNEIFPSAKGQNAAAELEKLTHEMCYLFGRATKAVSICPPAYYADIVCTRYRAYLSELFDGVISGGASVASGTSGSSGNAQRLLEAADKFSVHQKMKESMFYI